VKVTSRARSLLNPCSSKACARALRNLAKHSDDRDKPGPGPLAPAGYLVLDGFASAEQVAALRQRAEQLVGAFDAASVASVFSTKNQARLLVLSRSWLAQRCMVLETAALLAHKPTAHSRVVIVHDTSFKA